MKKGYSSVKYIKNYRNNKQVKLFRCKDCHERPEILLEMTEQAMDFSKPLNTKKTFRCQSCAKHIIPEFFKKKLIVNKEKQLSIFER